MSQPKFKKEIEFKKNDLIQNEDGSWSSKVQLKYNSVTVYDDQGNHVGSIMPGIDSSIWVKIDGTEYCINPKQFWNAVCEIEGKPEYIKKD